MRDSKSQLFQHLSAVLDFLTDYLEDLSFQHNKLWCLSMLTFYLLLILRISYVLNHSLEPRL